MQSRLDQIPAMADKVVTMASWRLNLSDDQKTQIKSLVDAGVQQNLPLVKQLAVEREAIKTATAINPANNFFLRVDIPYPRAA